MLLIVLCISALLSAPLHAATTPSVKDLNDRLSRAILLQNIKEVENTLKAGADINAQEDAYGETPLYKAVKTRNPVIIRFLLKHKDLDKERKIRFGAYERTAGEWAELLGYKDIATMLKPPSPKKYPAPPHITPSPLAKTATTTSTPDSAASTAIPETPRSPISPVHFALPETEPSEAAQTPAGPESTPEPVSEAAPTQTPEKTPGNESALAQYAKLKGPSDLHDAMQSPLTEINNEIEKVMRSFEAQKQQSTVPSPALHTPTPPAPRKPLNKKAVIGGTAGGIIVLALLAKLIHSQIKRAKNKRSRTK